MIRIGTNGYYSAEYLLNGSAPIALFLVVGMLYLLVSMVRHRLSMRKIIIAIMLIYLGCLIGVTVFPVNIFATVNPVHHLPFGGQGPFVNFNLAEVKQYAPIQIYGNLLLFLPLGFLAPLLWVRMAHVVPNLLLNFGASLLIECIQFVMVYFYLGSRSTDVVDLMTNTIGGLIGYCLFILVRRFFSEQVVRIQEK
jgi:glycopeptide antibiotics resistance protein